MPASAYPLDTSPLLAATARVPEGLESPVGSPTGKGRHVPHPAAPSPAEERLRRAMISDFCGRFKGKAEDLPPGNALCFLPGPMVHFAHSDGLYCCFTGEASLGLCATTGHPDGAL